MFSVPKTKSANNPHDLLDAAIKCRELGISTIPVIAKKPSIAWKLFQKEIPTEANLRKWFTDSKITGLAAILGEISENLICRDFDDFDAYHRWAETHPDFARTLPTSRTYRGYHVFARGPQRVRRSW